MMQDNIAEGFGQLVKGKFILGWKTVLYTLSFVVAISVYLSVINTIDPNSNIWRTVSRFFKTPQYQFFSGGEQGVYHAVVSAIETGAKNGDMSFSIDNVSTSGGSENAIKVLTNSNSFGLVQEESIKADDFIREELNYITPLYLERMHILLRRDSSAEVNFSYNHPPVLTANTDKDVLNLFANAKISTGPVGSGSIVISSYILGEIDSQIKEKNIEENQEVFNLSMGDGLKNIRAEYEGNDKIDILFNIAGAPVKEIKNLLNDSRYMLVGVDPSFVSVLNTKNKLNLRLADFKDAKDDSKGGIYRDSHKVSALGSYAWLISSKDVPNKDILQVLDLMESSAPAIARKLGVEDPDNRHSPLTEMKFHDLYKLKYDRENIGMLKSVFIFLSSLVVSVVFVFSFLQYVLSFRKQSQYFHKIVSIINSSFPVNTELYNNKFAVGEVPEDVDLPFKRPVVLEKQEEIIDSVVIGVQSILLLTDEINNDFQNGTLTNNSFTFLMTKIEDTRLKLQKHLARRLNEVIERGQRFKDDKILDDLRIYFTAGYLLDDDYARLKAAVKGYVIPPLLPAANGSQTTQEGA